MDLNETIFNSIKNTLYSEENESQNVDPASNELLLKVCLGTATEEEKNTWKEEKGISDDVLNKLKEYCDMGYNMAAQLDSHVHNDEKDILLKKIEDLTEEVNELRIRVEILEGNKERRSVPELCENNL